MTETQNNDEKSNENPPKSAQKVPFFTPWPELRFWNLIPGPHSRPSFQALISGPQFRPAFQARKSGRQIRPSPTNQNLNYCDGMVCTLFNYMNENEGIIYILIGQAQNVLGSNLWGWAWIEGLNWGPEMRAWNEGLKWGFRTSIQAKGWKMALFGHFSVGFHHFFCQFFAFWSSTYT